MTSHMQQNLIQDNHVITVPGCLAPLVGDPGISILAWSRGRIPPPCRSPLSCSPQAVPRTLRLADAVVLQVEMLLDLAEDPVPSTPAVSSVG